MRSLMQRLWAGGWGSSETRCLPTSLGGTSGVYLAPTASSPWGLSGTRRASESGKQRRKIGRVASRSTKREFERWGEGYLYFLFLNRGRPPREARHRRGTCQRCPISERSEAVRTLRECGVPPQDRAHRECLRVA